MQRTWLSERDEESLKVPYLCTTVVSRHSAMRFLSLTAKFTPSSSFPLISVCSQPKSFSCCNREFPIRLRETCMKHMMHVFVSLTGIVGSLTIKAAENTSGKMKMRTPQVNMSVNFLIPPLSCLYKPRKCKPKCLLLLTPNLYHLKRGSEKKKHSNW